MAQHNEGFLKLVNDAKTRIRETDVAGHKERLARGEQPVLVDLREDHESRVWYTRAARRTGGVVLSQSWLSQVSS